MDIPLRLYLDFGVLFSKEAEDRHKKMAEYLRLKDFWVKAEKVLEVDPR